MGICNLNIIFNSLQVKIHKLNRIKLMYLDKVINVYVLYTKNFKSYIFFI